MKRFRLKKIVSMLLAVMMISAFVPSVALADENSLYVVTFYGLENSVLKTQEVQEGKDATPPEDVSTPDGSRFTGWSGNYKNVTKNESVYAQFTREYTVTFLGGASQTDVLGTDVVLEGNAAQEPADKGAPEGQEFVGWDQDISAVTSDMTVTAQYQELGMSALRAPMGVVINTYTVAYDANGGTGSMSDGSSPYNEGASFQVLANTFTAPANLHFTGWNTAADGGGTAYTAGSTYTISGNIVLYAQWAPTTIHIYVYAGNNESNELEHRIVTATDEKILQYSDKSGLALLNLLQSDYGSLAGKSGSFSDSEVYSNGQIKLVADGAYNYKVIINVKKDTVTTSYTVKCLDEFNVEIDSYTVTGTRHHPLYVGDSVEEDAPYFFGYILTSADSQEITLNYSGNTIIFYYSHEYNVSYDANGGYGYMYDYSNPYYYGETFTARNNHLFAPDDKHFAGWNTAANGSGTPYAPGATGTITGDVTLYAQWAYDTYTVTYNANGGSGTMTDPNSPYNSGSSFTVLGNTFTAPANKHFVSWNTSANGNGTNYSVGSSQAIYSNKILYAKWAYNPKYTLTYNANGGSGAPMTDTNSPYYSGSTFTTLANTFNAPANKHFAGWNTAINGSGTAYAANATGTISANTTLYAQWAFNTYTVTYNANGGGGTMTDGNSPYNSGSSFTVLGNTFTAPANKHFVGWRNAAGGGGTIYNAGTSYTISGNVTLYAQWAFNTQYTVTYQANGGSGTMTDGSSPYYSGNLFTVLNNTFAAPANKHFVGWSTAVNGGTSYTAGNAYTISSNVVLYAQWAFNPQYTVSYQANGGGGTMADGSSPYYDGNPFTVLANGFTAPANQHFVGWNTMANGDGTNYTAGSSYNISGNVTLYAQWAFNAQYTVSYQANGGSGTMTDTLSPYYVGNPFTVLANGFTVPANQHFVGWNTEANGTGTVYTVGSSYNISGNVVLYAQWAFNAQYTVTYLANGGSGTMTDTLSPYYVGNPFTVLANDFTVPANQHFVGWNTAANGTGTVYTVDATYNISANVVLYAQWAYNALYTVSYDANGGTGTTTDTLSPYYDGNSYTVLANGFAAPANQHFVGWNTAANGTGTNYTAEATYTISGNVMLYAQWAFNPLYTVSYMPNGGSGTTTDTLSPYYDGNSYTVLANGFTAPANKHFTGWNTEANNTGTSYTVDASYSISGNVTLYAQWAYNPLYTVSYDANGGTGTTTDALSPYYEGNPFTVLANDFTAPAHKHFTGWNTAVNGTGTSYTVDASYNITANVTLYAQWEYDTHTVTYLANGGSGTTSDTLSPYTYGNPYTVLANSFTRTDYVFDHWNTEADGTGTTVAVSSSQTILADTTYYAIWELDVNGPEGKSDGIADKLEHAIVYNANSGVPASVPVDTNIYPDEYVATVLFTPVPTRNGYDFLGWSGTASVILPEFTSGGTTTLTMGTADRTLYAIWKLHLYTITYVMNDGTNVLANPATYTVESALITLAPPTRAGFDFLAWTPGNTIPAGSTGDKTFTATWSAPIVYPITYTMNGGLNAGANPANYTVLSLTINLADPARPGYIFLGWTPNDVIPTGSTGPRAFTATWSAPIVYNITYVMNGGTNAPGNPATYTVESPLITLADPTRTGYDFLGWTQTDNIPAGSIGNVTFTATWSQPHVHTVTYIVSGGTEAGLDGTTPYQVYTNVAYGTVVPVPNNPKQDEYSFDGWTTAIPVTMPDQDVVIYGTLAKLPALQEIVPNEKTPLAGPTWSLMNLILSVVTALSIGSIFTLLKKSPDVKLSKRSKAFRLLTLIPAIGAVLVFVLTQNMDNQMVLTDRWTILLAGIAAVQGAVIAFGFQRGKRAV